MIGLKNKSKSLYQLISYTCSFFQIKPRGLQIYLITFLFWIEALIMQFFDQDVSLPLRSKCDLHCLIFQYLNGEHIGLKGAARKKIYDGSRKFYIEDLEGNKQLRLKAKPSLKVHTDPKVVFKFNININYIRYAFTLHTFC